MKGALENVGSKLFLLWILDFPGHGLRMDHCANGKHKAFSAVSDKGKFNSPVIFFSEKVLG